MILSLTAINAGTKAAAEVRTPGDGRIKLLNVLGVSDNCGCSRIDNAWQLGDHLLVVNADTLKINLPVALIEECQPPRHHWNVSNEPLALPEPS